MKSFTSIINLTAIFILLFASCSKKSSTPDSMPSATISSVIQERTISSSLFKFSVILNKATANSVTVHYTTVAGTAEATKDFVPLTGTVSIAANQLQSSMPGLNALEY